MSLKKNQIFETTIENLSSDGSGVAHVEGQAVFVPGAAPGDVIRCRIVKALKSYAFGRILAPGPGRVAPDCAVCTPCGGCGLRHLSYATECEAKTGFVRDAFARLGGFDVSSFEFSPVLALTDHTAHYRNKVQLPVGLDADGHVVTGFYAGRTHRIVPLFVIKSTASSPNHPIIWFTAPPDTDSIEMQIPAITTHERKWGM